MADVLPRLRTNLDFMPSPLQDRPGLLIRDPYHYSDATLIIPPVFVQVLHLFEGSSTELDLRAALVRLTGEIEVSNLERHLIEALDKAGFLENETYFELREQRHREFAEAPLRAPAHSGSAYPEAPDEFRDTFAGYFAESAPDGQVGNLVGIAAPHVSPEGGWQSYRDAYRLLPPESKDRVFVVLGTSHYGAPERFGLTRKNYQTPLGEARTERSMVDRLEASAADAVIMEDYCHSTEHSIEFQVAFLHFLFGPDIRLLPILCGPFARSLYEGGQPEEDDRVKRFLGALGELHAAHGKELLWVLGIDMAHMGRRYGDSFAAHADRGEMAAVADRDRERIARTEAGDAHGFWELVRPNHDDLKWCGSSPLYTFLYAVPEARGRTLRYQQWNIDPQSVVSFAALAFTDGDAPSRR
jgi:AmmeMemoRadiSam system protein B